MENERKDHNIKNLPGLDFSKIKIIFLAILSLGILGLEKSSWGADWYVRKGATGSNNGTSWANAWSEMDKIDWSPVNPGDTIWLAGGTYTKSLAVDKSGISESQRIYIRKIRSTDAQCTVPCDDSYDSQVVFSTGTAQILWSYSGNEQLGSYVTIDGRVDSGIKATGGDADWGAAVHIGRAVTGVTLQFIEMTGPWNGTNTPNGDGAAFYAIPYTGSITDLSIRNCRLHGAVNLVKMSVNNALFEYNEFYDNWPTNCYPYHTNVLDSAGGNGIRIFRFNIVRDWINEGIMELSGSPTTWKVYANLFYKSYSGPWRMGSVVDSQYREHTLYFYNNDVVNTWAVVLRAGNNGSWSSDSRALNNIFWNMRDSDNNYLYGCPGLNSSDDYNFCDYSGITGPHSIGNGNNPFVDYPSNDFRIVPTIGAAYPRDKGIALAPEYAMDADDNMRGSDGTWDNGAYEYVQGPDTTPPAPPIGLSVQ